MPQNIRYSFTVLFMFTQHKPQPNYNKIYTKSDINNKYKQPSSNYVNSYTSIRQSIKQFYIVCLLSDGFFGKI